MKLKMRPRPLAWIDGRPVWPFAGAEGEGEGDNATGTQGGTGGAGSTQSGGTSDGGTSDKKDDAQSGGQSSSDDKVERSEFEAIKQKMIAADRRAEAAEKKAKEYEDKDKGELEKATERAEAAEKRVQALEDELADMRLNQAMLTDPNYGADKWHDVEDVLTRLRKAVKDDGSSVTIAEDGTVKGVSAFLKQLATNKKYLLKTAAQNAGGGASGDPANGDKRGGGGGSDGAGTGRSGVSKERRAKLAETYPSIRR